jgi:hypothetical protein
MNYQQPPASPGNDSPAALFRHAVEMARAVGLLLQGKSNNTGTLTLTAGTASTVMSDARLTVNSAVLFDPVTANAAAELAAGTLYTLAANRNNSVWTVTHANAGTTDRTFRYMIVG